MDAHGRRLRVLDRTRAQPGTPLRLDLDIDLQRAAQAALAQRPGAVVAIDPTSGHVLAMVSEPAFDPNLFVGGIGSADYRGLMDNPERPLTDRALRGLYPPGSTIKPLMALAGLVSGRGHARQSRLVPRLVHAGQFPAPLPLLAAPRPRPHGAAAGRVAVL